MDPRKPTELHAHVSATAPAVGQVVEALDAFCATEGVPEAVAWRFRVALDEIVANIVAYSAKSRTGIDPVLDVWFRTEPGAVEVTVADDGPPFNPLLHPDPDVTLPLEARKPGGLGIALVKSLMDDVRYERTDRNMLTIRKRLEPLPAEPQTGTDGHSTDGA